MSLNKLLFISAFLILFSSPVFGAVNTVSDQQISDFSLSGYGDKGKKSWDISGKSADIFSEVVKLKDIDGNLYDKAEKINLTAKKGDFNKTDGKVHLEEDVVITTSSGAKLTTDSMDWDRKKQVVSTDDKVNIDKDNISIVGTGAHGEPDLNKVALKKDIRVDINPLDSKRGSDPMTQDKVVITCDGELEVDYDKNIATFRDNVKVERPDLTIYSDQMDLYFVRGGDNTLAQNSNKSMASSIDKIVATGNVRIIRGENISYSEVAEYRALDKKIVLSGRPKIIFYSTEEFKNASFGN